MEQFASCPISFVILSKAKNLLLRSSNQNRKADPSLPLRMTVPSPLTGEGWDGGVGSGFVGWARPTKAAMNIDGSLFAEVVGGAHPTY
jgi:hypothetical protein